MKDKERDAYIKIIWSFGNNGRTYIFGKDIEDKKRSMHMAVVFDELDQYFKDTFKMDAWPKGLSITAKRLYLKKVISHLRMDMQQLEQLQQLERLQQLQQLEQLEQLEMTSLDYRKVKIKPNSVIYCDIPYKGTADYGNLFSHDDFFNWAANNKEPVFISEYHIDDNRFHLLKVINHRSSFSNGGNNKVLEKLYCNDAALISIKKQLSSKKSKSVVTKLKKSST